MSNLKRTYAEIISQAQVMATGLKANQAEVARRGIDTGFVTELEKTRLEAIALNDEQEKLKSALKHAAKYFQYAALQRPRNHTRTK